MPGSAKRQSDLCERAAAWHAIDGILRDMDLARATPQKARLVLLRVLEDAAGLTDSLVRSAADASGQGPPSQH